MPDEAPESRPERPYRRVEQDYSWQLPFVGLLASIGLAFAVWTWTREWPGSKRPQPDVTPTNLTPPPPPEPSPPPPRLLPGLVLFASPGSQEEDLWVIVEDPPSSGERWLARVSGATGRVTWRRSANDWRAVETGLRAWVDGGLLMAAPETVSALNPITGETLWTRDSGGPIRGLCAGDGFAGLMFSEDRVAAFSVSTGVTLEERTGSCEPVVTSRSVAPNFTMVDGAGIKPPLPPRAPFRGGVARVLVPHKGTARVVLASDRLAAAVAVAGRKSWVWSTRLAKAEDRVPRFLVPPLAAVRNQRVVVPYVLEHDSELRLASLDLDSGKLVWDRLLTSKAVAADAPDAELRVSRLGAIYFSDGRGRIWATTFDSRPAWSWGE